MIKVFLVLLLAALVVVYGHPADPRAPTYPDTSALYDYKYGVLDEESGNDFGHEESRDSQATAGRYYVLLPDGRVQTVLYSVIGDEGYVADVSYARRRR
ncbi:pro-resilin-like [Panulirus ornatus]|uniref:pro-resilin-like n=1 Tax=Panulirus ornatus TaxID=150431 RepID=UPI003A856651